ncbi:hypothetical protein K1719_020786 [Acacia pycnantha]|nr:hypothetical protein K1719_020786 [Acacia pycnantha]
MTKALNDTSAGEDILIDRIDMNPCESKLPYKMTRRQFPIIISFAMTINKSQGQSMSHVGLYLPSSIFSHGQLYVALSKDQVVAASSKPGPTNQAPLYRVDFPAIDVEEPRAIIPFVDLSLINAVTSGVQNISLKRHQESLEEEARSFNPPKKRLLCLEPAAAKPEASHINIRKLKNSLRGKKNKQNAKARNAPIQVGPAPPLFMGPDETSLSTTSPNDCNVLPHADGCHQAAIGSP